MALKLGIIPQWTKDGTKIYTTLLQVIVLINMRVVKKVMPVFSVIMDLIVEAPNFGNYHSSSWIQDKAAAAANNSRSPQLLPKCAQMSQDSKSSP